MLERIRALSPAPSHVDIILDDDLGLEAVLVLDNLVLGPAAGGIRRASYRTFDAALDDALRLARAMTMKTALSGLDAGGGKLVIRDRPGLDLKRVYTRIGERVEELRGAFRTAGDLGTTKADLEVVASVTSYVHLDEEGLTTAVGETVARCAMEALGSEDLKGARVAVQGAGAIGAQVALALRGRGAQLLVADIDQKRAQALAELVRGKVVSPADVLVSDVDVVCPCARGGELDAAVAKRVRAKAVVPGANNALASPDAESTLLARNIAFVPDVISSAGAVALGISRSVMGADDPAPFYDRVQAAARRALAVGREGELLPSEWCEDEAFRRIDRARGVCPV